MLQSFTISPTAAYKVQQLGSNVPSYPGACQGDPHVKDEFDCSIRFRLPKRRRSVTSYDIVYMYASMEPVDDEEPNANRKTSCPFQPPQFPRDKLPASSMID
jgi:hypothetical protein